MSIIPLIDDYLFPNEQRPWYYSMSGPSWRHSNGLFSNVLNEGFRELQKLERQLGDLKFDVNSDPLKG